MALSNVTIVGGTLANLAFNVGRRHPAARRRPLIDWDLILLMEPSTILGALAGGYVHQARAGWARALGGAVVAAAAGVRARAVPA